MEMYFKITNSVLLIEGIIRNVKLLHSNFNDIFYLLVVFIITVCILEYITI